jgi:glutathione peroxidase
MENQTFHSFTIKTPAGELVDLGRYKGNLVLAVNTATRCGLAPQFDGLEKLHQKYQEKGLVVLGFPSDQFMNQEPETDETMIDVCRVNHGVTFQLFQKIDVNGKTTHPVYQYLKSQKGGFLTNRIKWNFTKFLIGKDGVPVKRYSPTTPPLKIEGDILKLL